MTTWNYSFWCCRREVDDEILRPHLRTAFHFTSGRRPPCRRRGCLSSLVSMLNDWHSQQGLKLCWRSKGKAWDLRFIVRTLYFGTFVYIFIDDTSKKNGCQWWICDLHKHMTPAELAPGRQNQIQIHKFT